MEGLKKGDKDTSSGTPRPGEMKNVQRLWIRHRDASVRLFVSLNPSVDEAAWKSWFTDARIKELSSLLKRLEGTE
jgi:hypothetical protein